MEVDRVEGLEELEQIKEKDPRLLKIFLKEIDQFFLQLFFELQKDSVSPRKVLTILHTMKGGSLTAGLNLMAKRIHELESTFLHRSGRLVNFNNQEFVKQVEKLQLQWKSKKAVFRNERLQEQLKGHDKDQDQYKDQLKDQIVQYLENSKETLWKSRGELALEVLNLLALAEEELQLQARVKVTAKALGKEGKLTCVWNDVLLDPERRNRLNSCLIHFITNALDHGIETPRERRAKGKSNEGKLELKLWEGPHWIYGSFTDDGRGFAGESDQDDQEILDQLFKRKSEAPSVYSGRGLGLMTISSLMQEMGGGLKLERRNMGTKWSFSFLSGKDLAIDKRLIPLEEMLRKMTHDLSREKIEVGLKLKWMGKESRQDQNFAQQIYCQPELLTMALSSLLLVKRENDVEKTIISLITPSCRRIIEQHQGLLSFQPQKLVMEMKTLNQFKISWQLSDLNQI